MADQPLNTDIKIYRTVRAQREILRADSVKNITGKLRRLILVAPGQEYRTAYGTRTAVTDFSAFMGQAVSTGRGFPVSVGVQAAKDIAVIDSMAGIDFPVAIGADLFIAENSDNVGGDLQASARAAT